MSVPLSADLKRDYCNWETFSAQCSPGHTILMTTANYGRMHLGRCIPETYDREGKPSVIGCAENIMRYSKLYYTPTVFCLLQLCLLQLCILQCLYVCRIYRLR